MKPHKLGIIAGGGDLPQKIIRACLDQGRPFFVLALEGQAEPDLPKDTDHQWIRMGAWGQAMDILHQAKVTDLVMAGPVKRPSLWSVMPDAKGAAVLARIGFKALGDDGLLRALASEMEKEGFRVVGIEEVLGNTPFAPEGVMGKYYPDDQAKSDIQRGISVLKALSSVDVGQACVVQQGIVLGVEAIEGTDALLERCVELKRQGAGGVLIKIRKTGQDDRLDRPTVGVQTILAAKKADLQGLAIEADGAIILDKDKTIQAANEAGLFLIGVKIPS